jgi:hypothetical protein
MTSNSKQYKTYNLHLRHIHLQEDRIFEDLVSIFLGKLLYRLELQNNFQAKMLAGYGFNARSIIEYLCQLFGSGCVQCKVAITMSNGAYGSKDYQLTEYSHSAVLRVIDALESCMKRVLRIRVERTCRLG